MVGIPYGAARCRALHGRSACLALGAAQEVAQHRHVGVSDARSQLAQPHDEPWGAGCPDPGRVDQHDPHNLPGLSCEV